MSPEQATGDRELDARSDIYSLAAVLYEMLAGEPPHSGATAQVVIAKLMTERPTRIRTVRDTVPEGIDNAVAKALAKVPADRFSSANGFVSALALESPSLRTRQSAHPFLIAACVILVLAGIGITAASLLRRSAPRIPRSYQPQQLTTTGHALTPVVSPDGSLVAYVDRPCDEGGRCSSRIIMREAASGVERTVMSGLDVASLTHWSPDGLWLLAWIRKPGESYAYVAISRIGGESRNLGISITADFLGRGDTVALLSGFHPHDGRWPIRLASASSSLEYGSFNLVSPVVRGRLLPAGLAISPDGRWLAVSWQAYPRSFLTIHDRTGKIRDSTAAANVVYRWTVDSRSLLLANEDPGSPGRLVRIAFDPGRGRFGTRDTLSVDPQAGELGSFDLSANGRVLVYDGRQAGTFELWALERKGQDFVPARKLRESSVYTTFALSPDGQTAYFEVPDGGGKETVAFHAMPFDGGPERTITPPYAGGIWMTLGRDGKHLFEAVKTPRGARLTSYDVTTGRGVLVADFPDTAIVLDHGPGGGVVATLPPYRKLQFFGADGRHFRDFTVPDSIGPFWGGAISPDGAHYALGGVYDTSGSTIRFPLFSANLENGKIEPLLTFTAVALGQVAWTSSGMHTLMDPGNGASWAVYLLTADGSPPVREAGFPALVGPDPNCRISLDVKRMLCMVSRPVDDIYLIRDFDATGH
jgi:hypothetical protein